MWQLNLGNLVQCQHQLGWFCEMAVPKSSNMPIIMFHKDHMSITFHGTKKDMVLSGFPVDLPAMENPLLDPIYALHTYIA